MENIIEFNNVSKSYKKRKKRVDALKKISFSVKPGELFGIIGENGAGKTTLLSILSTILRPSSGKVTMFGLDISKNRNLIRQRIGTLFQQNILDPQLTVKNTFLVFSKLKKLKKSESSKRIAELISFTGLEGKANTPVKSLSGGMVRKLYIALSVLARPEILMLDEPTNGLDPIFRNKIWEFLLKNKEKNQSIILSTHYMEEAEICSRIIVMKNGRIIAHGTPEELKNSVGLDIIRIGTKILDDKVKHFISTIEKKMIVKAKIEKNAEGILIDIPVKKAVKNISKVLEQCASSELDFKDIISMEIKKVDLNDVFIYYAKSRELE